MKYRRFQFLDTTGVQCPETLNQKKAAKVGDRHVQLARKWHKDGVLSAEGFSPKRKAAPRSLQEPPSRLVVSFRKAGQAIQRR